jgi:hypothetical protein
MEMLDLFGDEFSVQVEDTSGKYTKKVETPIYEPRGVKPHILELCDNEKTKRLIREIENSSLDEFEKKFLIEAAHRHSVFNYSKIADYYAHASKEMQELMEKSALVIIDFNKAIEYGFVKLNDKMKMLYERELQESRNE